MYHNSLKIVRRFKAALVLPVVGAVALLATDHAEAATSKSLPASAQKLSPSQKAVAAERIVAKLPNGRRIVVRVRPNAAIVRLRLPTGRVIVIRIPRPQPPISA